MVGTAKKCNYVDGSNKPCSNCPKKITYLYNCRLLQELSTELNRTINIHRYSHQKQKITINEGQDNKK